MTDLNDNQQEVKRELEANLQSMGEEVERWKSKCQTLETQLKEVSYQIKLVFDLETKGIILLKNFFKILFIIIIYPLNGLF